MSNLFPVVYFVKFKCILCSLNISLIVNASKKENVLLLQSAKHHFESSANLRSQPKSRRHLTASDYNPALDRRTKAQQSKKLSV